MIALTAFVISSCSSSESSQERMNLSQKITMTYSEFLLKKYEGQKEYFDYEINAKHWIELFVGHDTNIYAVVFNTYLASWNTVAYINIDDYCSETYYHPYALPVIYIDGSIYSYDDAYYKGLINLEFVKSFDEFQKSHTPEELNNIYLD